MIIVAGGDSFVWGSELSDHRHGGHDGYSRLTFPSLLAADDQYICAAYPGYSNEEIAQGVYRVLSKGGIGIPFIFVCWTWPGRDKHYRSSRIVQSLQESLKYHRIPYLFTCADNCLLEWLTDDTDWDHWFLFPSADESWNTQEPRGFYQWAVESNYPVGSDGHPLDAAHAAAAELIKGKFDVLVKKTIL
jgi:hypothetical protein